MCASKSLHEIRDAKSLLEKSMPETKAENGAVSSHIKDQLIQAMRLRRKEAVEYLEATFGHNSIGNLCNILGSSPSLGISCITSVVVLSIYLLGLPSTPDDLSTRRFEYGTNEIPQKKPKSFFMLLIDALKDVTLVILMIAALISLLLSFFEVDSSPSELYLGNDTAPALDVTANSDMESRANWIEAVAIVGTVMIVAFVTALNNYQKEKQFRGLQAKIEADQLFSVIRDGAVTSIPLKEIVVGDVCQLQYGDVIPADGLVVFSNDLKIDESSLTGESELVKKSMHADPVLLSGTKVMEGSGRMLVIAVGLNSQTGRICSLLGLTASDSSNFILSCSAKDKKLSSRESVEGNENIKPPSSQLDLGRSQSPMQLKLEKLSIRIGYIGVIAAILTTLVLSARFCIDAFLVKGLPWNNSYLQIFVRFIILGVTVIVVSVPEGLPLAVTLALAYSVRQMMHDNNLVRHLDACETMGNATAICCDKTGTLTTNKMSVVEAYINGRHISQGDTVISKIDESALPKCLADLACEAICVNSSRVSMVEPATGPGLPTYFGNRTECALLAFVFRILVPTERKQNPILKVRSRYSEDSIVKVFTFNSRRKSMSTAVRLTDGTIRLYVKGASEVLLNKCYFVVGETLTDKKSFSDTDRSKMNETVIQPMARSGLRTVCIAFRDFGAAEKIDWEDEDSVVSSLTFIGIFGIADPVRPEVPDAIRKCQRAGVIVRMVTGDNIDTARSIAQKCGIVPEYDDERLLVLESKDFNCLIRNPETGSIEQSRMDKVWPYLRVLARSTPEDKYNLVKGIIASKINSIGEIVAVTGDGTNDAPALHEADVGFAMGIAGTEVAKEASDIILTDDNFASLVKALVWGRNVYDSIAKFIQFQLTVNVVASLITVISAAVLEDAVVTAIQMLYVNLLMDTLASLALSTEPPSSRLLNRSPYGRNNSLVSATMAKNILMNSFYQLFVLLLLTFYGDQLFSIESGRHQRSMSVTSSAPTQHFTTIFNAFVLMTLFNELGARRLHNERNVFGGLHKSKIFLLIWFGSLASQILVIEFGGIVFRTTPLTIDQWLWCVFFGIGQLLWGQLSATLPLEKSWCLAKLFGSNGPKMSRTAYRSQDPIESLPLSPTHA